MYGIYDTSTSKVIAEFVSPITVRSNQPVFISDTLSLKRSAYKRATQRWEIETKLSPTSYGAQDLMINLLTSGYSATLKILTPQNFGARQRTTCTAALTVNTPASIAVTAVAVGSYYMIASVGTTVFTSMGAANNNVGTIFKATAIGTGTGTVTLVNGIGAGSLNINLAATGGLISKGTFIKFSNHDKVYITTADTTVSTVTTSVLNFYPTLRSPVPGGSTLTYQEDVQMTVRYDTDTVIGMVYEDGILMDNGTIKLIDAL